MFSKTNKKYSSKVTAYLKVWHGLTRNEYIHGIIGNKGNNCVMFDWSCIAEHLHLSVWLSLFLVRRTLSRVFRSYAVRTGSRSIHIIIEMFNLSFNTQTSDLSLKCQRNTKYSTSIYHAYHNKNNMFYRYSFLFCLRIKIYF